MTLFDENCEVMVGKYRNGRYFVSVIIQRDATIYSIFISVAALHVSGEFCIFSSVHRNCRLKKSNKMQQYAHIYLLLNYCTCFGRPSRPSSGVHKKVFAASGTDHTVWGASFFKRDQLVLITRCKLKSCVSWHSAGHIDYNTEGEYL